MKKISVIIPCYNVVLYVDRCLSSIIEQTMGIDDLEIICVDDGSTDGTWEHLQRWEQNFPEHVLLIRQEVNRKQGAARNIGLQYASADWISFVDADDWLEPDYFELLYEPVGMYSCDVVSCGIRVDDADIQSHFKREDRAEGEDRYILSETKERKREMLIHKPWGEGPCAKIIRKELLINAQIFFPEGLAYEDNYWVPLLHVYANSGYVIGQKLYHYFINPQSTIYKQNAHYHVDWITIQLKKWKNYSERGLLEEYCRELEFDLLYNAVCFMKTLVLRYEQPSFPFYQLEKQVIQQRIPDYKKSPYADAFKGIAGLLLEALYIPMNKSEFQKFVETAKSYYVSQRAFPEQKEKSAGGQSLRIVMFYSETESFNFFTDRLTEELEKRGHEIFVCDLDDISNVTEHSYDNLNRFISKKVDVVICFDGLGTREDQLIRQWNRHQAVVVDILMDPPFRFHPTLEKHPEKYQLFCCDLEHVEYVKKYFNKEVSAVAFMPHAGTKRNKDIPVIPYKEMVGQCVSGEKGVDVC